MKKIQMKKILYLAALAAVTSLSVAALRAADDPAGPGYPAWAYAITPPPPPGTPRPPAPEPDKGLKQIPGSTRSHSTATSHAPAMPTQV